MSEQVPFLFDVPSVSELTEKIKQLLEHEFVDILVEGEASNVKQSANGHIYFTLKDASAQLPCVIWRSTVQRAKIKLTDGQQIVVGGDLQVYAPHGRYQMIVTLVQQAGIGKLQQAFEELKAKLKAEGLFDAVHKKPVPKFPKRIGVVTSKTTAAFQDIRSTLEKRWPVAEVDLFHASVQGVHAAPELVRGLNYFSESGNVDVIILSRGGGSLEDLWPFNEEAVARAVFACKVPVISAVGHEVDFSISDFVADLRAATPTQAAVLATPDINEIKLQVDHLARKLELHIQGVLQYYKERVITLAKSHALQAIMQKIETARSTVERLQQQARVAAMQLHQSRKTQLRELQHRLEILNPNEPLRRGFARIWQNDSWVRNAAEFNSDSPTEIEWKDGKTTLNR